MQREQQSACPPSGRYDKEPYNEGRYRQCFFHSTHLILIRGSDMATMLCLLYALISIASLVDGLTPAQWRAQSIYQVMTDRFARTDGSTSAACDFNEYCGGTWRGLINRLGYIQNMVGQRVETRSLTNVSRASQRSGYRLLYRTPLQLLEMAIHTTATGQTTSTS